MSADFGLALTFWTVRAAVGCYAARVLCDAADVGSPRLRRAVWTAGFVLYAVHVAAAFESVHHWSHADAERETARQTAAVTGWNWGGGVWIGYAFTLLWAADTAAWWAAEPDRPRRFRRTATGVQAVFAFLMFNATAVFGPPFWRPVVAAFALLLAAAWAFRGGRRRPAG